MRLASFTITFWTSANASRPWISISPVEAQSNTPALLRTARCSARGSPKWSGISQPWAGRIFAPACSS